jgi:phosphatidate cytidylyltransferase
MVLIFNQLLMLRTRALTAVAMLVICLPIMFLDDPRALQALGLVLVSLAAWEWARMNLPQTQRKMPVVFGLIVLDSGVFMLNNPASMSPSVALWVILGVTWLLLGGMVLKSGMKTWASLPSLFRCFLGYVVLLACWWALCLAKNMGLAFLLSCLGLVWCADISAYFVGRAFGKNKLAPQLSPGKTWEGALGAWILVSVLAWAWVQLAGSSWLQMQSVPEDLFSKLWARGPWWFFPLLAVLVALSVIGDLFESLMKRAHGVKDSSHLLPGHGGVLDRLDAVLSTLPWCVCLALYF